MFIMIKMLIEWLLGLLRDILYNSMGKNLSLGSNENEYVAVIELVVIEFLFPRHDNTTDSSI